MTTKKEVTPIESQIIWAQFIGGRPYQLRTTIKGNPTRAEILKHVEAAVDMVKVMDAQGDLPGAAKTASAMTTPAPVENKVKADPTTGEIIPEQPRYEDVNPQGDAWPSIMITSTEVSVQKGKVCLKVKGGDYTAFGIPLWPEVAIEEGLVPDEETYNHLDIHNPPDLRGWVAFYSTTTTREGTVTPKKVVALRQYKQQKLV